MQGECNGTSTEIADVSGIYWTPVRQSDITWNFEKFLVDQQGRPFKRYNPAVDPKALGGDIQFLMNRR